MSVKCKLLTLALGIGATAMCAGDNGESLLSPTTEVTRGRELARPVPAEKPNEIRRGGVVYHGLLIQAARTDNRWQLINPAAPAEYGSGEANLALDPISLRPAGLYLFAISF